MPAHVGIARRHISILFMGNTFDKSCFGLDQCGSFNISLGSTREMSMQEKDGDTGDNKICSKNVLIRELKEEPKERQVTFLAAKL